MWKWLCYNFNFLAVITLQLVAEHMQSKEEVYKTLKDNWPILIFTIFVFYYLRRMHYIHVDRQYRHMKRVVDKYDERKKNAQ